MTRRMILELAEIAEGQPETARRLLIDLRRGLIPLKKARHLDLHRGSLVEIKSNKPEISQKLARVAVVNEATAVVVLRDTETMEMVRHRLRLEEVEPVPLEREPKVKAIALRLDRLREKALDPFEREILDLLEQRVVLTPVEEEHLRKLELKYSLDQKPIG
jgi:hypothetical protein